MMAVPHTIIFDLDGTLVDSSFGILASLETAFRLAEVDPVQPFHPSLIGPTLRETVALLAPRQSISKVDQIIATFKSSYDSSGYLATKVYPGVSTMLSALKSSGFRLHIATNKRASPTRLILSCLRWNDFFESVYSPDSVLPPSVSKAQLISIQLDRECLSCHQALYVGDRLEDWHSAQANGLCFAWAHWGFGANHTGFPEDIITLPTPESLAAFLGISFP